MLTLWNRLFSQKKKNSAHSVDSGRNYRRLAFESMEDRRLLSATQMAISLDGAYNSEAEQVTEGIIYNLEAAAQITNYSQIATYYLNVYFSSEGLEQVNRETLTDNNTDYFSIGSDAAGTWFPYFQISPSTQSLASVVLHKDKGNLDGDSKTDWYLSICWNEPMNALWCNQTFDLFDFALHISDETSSYAGTVHLNFTGYDYQTNWNTTLTASGETIPIGKTVDASTIPHYSFQLPGDQRLGAPTNLQLSPIDYQSVSVQWDAVDGAKEYLVQWRGESSADFSEKTVSSTSCTIDGLSGGTTYTVQVVALNGSIQSEPSNSKEITTDQDAPIILSPSSITVDVDASVSTELAEITATDPNPNHQSFTFTFADTGTIYSDSGYFRIWNQSIKLRSKISDLPDQNQTLKIVATDEAGFTSEPFTVQVTFYKKPTAAVNQTSVTVQEGCSFCLSAADSVGYYGAKIASYAWDLDNDGTVDSYDTDVMISTSQLGTANEDGTYTVTLTVTDDQGRTSKQTEITVTVIPEPVTLSFAANTFDDGQILKLNLSLLGNDVSPQGWKVCWNKPEDSAQADWEDYDQVSSRLITAHYYARQTAEQTCTVAVKIQLSDSQWQEFQLISYTIPGTGSPDAGEATAALPETGSAVVSAAVSETVSAAGNDSAVFPLAPAQVLLENETAVSSSEQKISAELFTLYPDEAEMMLAQNNLLTAPDFLVKKTADDLVFSDLAESDRTESNSDISVESILDMG